MGLCCCFITSVSTLEEACGGFVAGRVPPWVGFLDGVGGWKSPFACICECAVNYDVPCKADAINEGLTFFSIGTPGFASYQIDPRCQQSEVYFKTVQCIAPIDAPVP